MSDESELEKKAKDTKVSDDVKKKAEEARKKDEAFNTAYQKVMPSAIARVLGIGAGLAATAYLAPFAAAFAPTATLSYSISSYIGMAAQYVATGLAALTGGLAGYLIPTKISRTKRAKEYMKKEDGKKKEQKPGYNQPGLAPAQT